MLVGFALGARVVEVDGRVELGGTFEFQLVYAVRLVEGAGLPVAWSDVLEPMMVVKKEFRSEGRAVWRPAEVVELGSGL